MADFGIDGIDNLDRLIARLPGSVGAGVALVGEAAKYGLVWEWGRVDVNPGPKTLWSTSPGGYPAVLTITAPHGWIRVNRDQYIAILRDEMKRANLGSVHPTQWPDRMRAVLALAAERCANLMAMTAPYDTGLLRESIKPVQGGDPILDDGEDALDLGTSWV